jgi:Na+/H+ antiporter NhaD/arsenite permease-like protein
VLVFGIPLEFALFGATLVGVAAFHDHTLRVALVGASVITLYKLFVTGVSGVPGAAGVLAHLGHEWVTLVNLLCLLVGFALLSRHFEESEVPDVLPRYLPDDWKGGFVLLVLVFVLSSFLDNIAAALIGGTIAQTVFRHKVHVGYLAAIVAASNAGGAGSVVGDTTTTMIWLAGVSPLAVLPAFVASATAVAVFGIPASIQQQRHQPILKHERRGHRVEWGRLTVVGVILVAAIVVNVFVNTRVPDLADHFPFIGAAVWVAILATARYRRPDWSQVPGATKGAAFLLLLVWSASLMPVEELPPASWMTAFQLGFVSAVFDNIPLTALAIRQGGYDWGMLAYAVGFGGSMMWFGSSAGVAVSNLFPQAKSVTAWVRGGWHVTVGYVVGFFVMLAIVGWNPTPKRERAPAAAPAAPVVVPAASAPGVLQGVPAPVLTPAAPTPTAPAAGGDAK